jgi:hypothetical protein
MHADAKHQSLLVVQHLVETRHALLDIDRRRDSGHGRSKLGQQGIACAVDQRAAGGFDRRPPDFASRRREVHESEVFVAFGHADGAGEVGVKDCG